MQRPRCKSGAASVACVSFSLEATPHMFSLVLDDLRLRSCYALVRFRAHQQCHATDRALLARLRRPHRGHRLRIITNHGRVNAALRGPMKRANSRPVAHIELTQLVKYRQVSSSEGQFIHTYMMELLSWVDDDHLSTRVGLRAGRTDRSAFRLAVNTRMISTPSSYLGATQ